MTDWTTCQTTMEITSTNQRGFLGSTQLFFLEKWKIQFRYGTCRHSRSQLLRLYCLRRSSSSIKTNVERTCLYLDRSNPSRKPPGLFYRGPSRGVLWCPLYGLTYRSSCFGPKMSLNETLKEPERSSCRGQNVDGSGEDMRCEQFTRWVILHPSVNSSRGRKNYSPILLSMRGQSL